MVGLLQVGTAYVQRGSILLLILLAMNNFQEAQVSG